MGKATFGLISGLAENSREAARCIDRLLELATIQGAEIAALAMRLSALEEKQATLWADVIVGDESDVKQDWPQPALSL